MANAHDRAHLSDLCLVAARAGGRAIQVLAGDGITVETKSSAYDYVTSADHASEAAILNVIKSARPGDAVLAEETGVHDGVTTTRWIVDPLDGTANFVHGRREYGTAVGVEQDGHAVAGAIVRHSDGAWAMGGGERATSGAADRSGGRTFDVTLPRCGAQAERSLVAVGLPYAGDKRRLALKLVSDLVPSIGAVRISGSAACDFVGLARGECDAYVAVNLAKWDTAAGEAIVVAAGGVSRTVTYPVGLTVQIFGPRSTVDQLELLLSQN